MRAGLSFSYSPISLLLRQPLSIKKSYAGAIQLLSSSHAQMEVIYILLKGKCRDIIDCFQ
jgi:hypothetical protein